MKQTTKLEKIFKVYAAKLGREVKSFRFLLDGQRIDPHETPKTLHLEENDQIDAMLEQVGNAFKLIMIQIELIFSEVKLIYFSLIYH